jgi:hypothetical protein
MAFITASFEALEVLHAGANWHGGLSLLVSKTTGKDAFVPC